MTAIEAKFDAMMNRMNNQEKIIQLVNEVGIINGVEKNNVVKQGLAQEGAYRVEEAQYLSGNRSYNFNPNNNLPTHYTLALRNHENLSYGGGMQKGPRLAQNYHQNYAPPEF